MNDGAVDPGVARAGSAVAARRTELGISQRELARRKIITAPALSAFAGWATQAGQRTVAGTIDDALSTVFRTSVVTRAAGRTDTGVHATGQVAHVDVPADVFILRPSDPARGSGKLLYEVTNRGNKPMFGRLHNSSADPAAANDPRSAADRAVDHGRARPQPPAQREGRRRYDHVR